MHSFHPWGHEDTLYLNKLSMLLFYSLQFPLPEKNTSCIFKYQAIPKKIENEYKASSYLSISFVWLNSSLVMKCKWQTKHFANSKDPMLYGYTWHSMFQFITIGECRYFQTWKSSKLHDFMKLSQIYRDSYGGFP